MRCIEKTLYTNGRIVTMDAAGTVAEAVLVAGNVIEAVGSKDGLAALAGPGCRTVDLKGASLYPGFIDTHSHASLYAMWKTHCRCPGIAHLEDVYPLIRKQAERVQIDGSGRTDAGVHASGQTASVVLPGKVDTALFTEKMNGCLPPDIRILDVELVKNGFHARKSAVGKVYEYRIDTGIKQDVFTRKYSGHFPGEPDLARMREAAGYLTGTHFFAGYTDKKDNRSVRRTIYSIMIRDERKDFLPCGKSDQIGNGNCIVIRYDGTGFLYHMVRILTGTLLEVGMRERTAESVKEALLTGDRSKAGFLAPAGGLFLREVRYE